MAKKIEKNVEFSKDEIYDVWDLKNGEVILGSYFVPKSITGQDYENALSTAKNKLVEMGFTTLEINAIIGRQLF